MEDRRGRLHAANRFADFGNSARGRSLRIALIYMLVGFLWIVLSDILSVEMFVDHDYRLAVSIAKGLAYVLVTAMLVYLLACRSMKQVLAAEKSAHRANRESEKKDLMIASLIESVPDLIFHKDSECTYVWCNSAFSAYTGMSRDEVAGKTDFDIFSPEMAEGCSTKDRWVMDNRQSMKYEEVITRRDGTGLEFETLKTPYYDPKGEVAGVICVCRDVTQRTEKEREIVHLNRTDRLTGLYNRGYLAQTVREMSTPDRHPLSVIVGDINGLRVINDALGHLEGDRMITAVANVIKSCCREGDIAARTGGDEFTVLLPCTDQKTAKEIAQRMDKACREWGKRERSDILRVSVAFGYATRESPMEEMEKVRQQAEEKMYRQKMLEYKSMRSGVLSSFKRAMLEKSYETEEHAERMEELSRLLGNELELSPEDLVDLQLLCVLHDVGKISVDKDVLLKTEPLTDDDWLEIKKHPEVGYRILRSSPDLLHIADYVLHHHERWDGTGYPGGLKEEEIPLLSRILAVVDAYDAMTQDRGYRPAMPKAQAAEEIIKCAGSQFDLCIAAVFVKKVLGE